MLEKIGNKLFLQTGNIKTFLASKAYEKELNAVLNNNTTNTFENKLNIANENLMKQNDSNINNQKFRDL